MVSADSKPPQHIHSLIYIYPPLCPFVLNGNILYSQQNSGFFFSRFNFSPDLKCFFFFLWDNASRTGIKVFNIVCCGSCASLLPYPPSLFLSHVKNLQFFCYYSINLRVAFPLQLHLFLPPPIISRIPSLRTCSSSLHSFFFTLLHLFTPLFFLSCLLTSAGTFSKHRFHLCLDVSMRRRMFNGIVPVFCLFKF